MATKHLTSLFEVKELAPNGYVAGYASVFNTVDAQREAVMQGAFTRSLKEWNRQGRRPAMLWMHDPNQPVGVWNSLREDAQGLQVEGTLAIKTQQGADAYELLKMGAVTGLSIGYRTVQSATDARTRVRKLNTVDLYEVSLVTFPANDQARIHAVKTPIGETELASRAIWALAAQLHEQAQRLKS